ncbi:MAG: hypothetical protein JWM47_3645 [Acidimicrobiales bacterium]|nr:hypothetical protein [Acidimicrobiales bacterium]
MTEPAAAAPPADEVSLSVAASPEDVYAVVSDVTGMGRLSPECTGGRWLDGATGPAVGARFKGTNKRGPIRWSTTNTVVAAEPGRAFAFETAQSGTRWRFDLAPEGDGTRLTQSRAPFKPYPLVARVFTSLLLGGVDDHAEELRAGMRATLERVKEVAEAG